MGVQMRVEGAGGFMGPLGSQIHNGQSGLQIAAGASRGGRDHVTARGKERKAIFRLLVGNSWEQSHLERLVPPVNWARIIAVVEQGKKERWRELSSRKEIGDAMPPCGWGGGQRDYVWRNWGSWPGGWITRPWRRQLAGLISGC
jgi:hypothetical protein